METETPETDALIMENGRAIAEGKTRPPIWEIMKKLERERDAALAVLMAIEERFTDGCDTYEDWLHMGNAARDFLQANAEVHPPSPAGASTEGGLA